MSTITITLDVPDGTTFNITATKSETIDGVPLDIAEAVVRLVPDRYQPWVMLYLSKAINDLECTVEFPNSDERLDDYLNVFPPKRCRRARTSGITYSSSRTAVFTGPVDVSGYVHAVETYNSGVYRYPKVPHLDSAEAVEEALMLTVMAIQRLER